MKIKEGGVMGIQKLTKEQAVIISGFTGILCGEFSDFHADVEKRLGRGVQTFEFGFKEFATEVKKLYEADFIEMGTVDKEQAKAQAVPEGFVLVEKAKLMQIIGSVSMIAPITRGNPHMDSVKRELTAITDVVKTVIEAQEQSSA